MNFIFHSRLVHCCIRLYRSFKYLFLIVRFKLDFLDLVMELDHNSKVDILWKRYNTKSSTSVRKNSFEEREAPESFYPVFSEIQLYSQAHLLTHDVPSDLQSLTETDMDDLNRSLSGSFSGRTSLVVPVIRRFIKLPLVAIPSPCGKAFQAPKCITLTAVVSFVVGEIIVGQVSGARGSIVKIDSRYIFFKGLCGTNISFRIGELIQGRISSLTATVAQDIRICPLSQVMRHIIPFDYGRGGYAYRVFRTDGSSVRYGESRWLLDTFSGVLTFYGSCPQGISDATPPLISFYQYIGKIGLNTRHSPDGNVGIGTESPHVSLDVHTTDAIRLPSGTSVQRPDPAFPGYLRFNTDIESLEVFDCCQWIDVSKGLGPGSDDVMIGTGGIDRQVVIGNTTGTSGVSVLAGAGDISLSSGNNISIDANSNLSLHTRSPGPSVISIGNHDPNLTISLLADGSNSRINLQGPVNLTGLSNIAVSGAYNYGSGDDDNDWRTLQLPCPNDSTTTSLFVQKRIAGTWTTRFRFD